MRVLTGDIGGTKTRLAMVEAFGTQVETLIEEAYSSQSYASLETIVDLFLEGPAKGMGRERACFGVAGPVRNGKCRTTNLPWEIDVERLAAQCGLQRVGLLNDLEATGYGIAVLGDDDFYLLNAGAPGATGNAAVIAAGTGLGEAGLYWDGVRYTPFPTEGGHSSFSPTTDLEIALLQYLRGRYGRVSWERVLSGSGLVNLYQFLRDTEGEEEPDWLAEAMRAGDPAAAISEAALSGRSTACENALDLFVRLYGVEAGDQALKLMAVGGVFIGGGIAPKILEKLKGPVFMEAFCAKGRMGTLLAAIPVKVILNERTALLGPAVYAVLS